jgi:meiotically up-regulated gene 157 (Mug157) protein
MLYQEMSDDMSTVGEEKAWLDGLAKSIKADVAAANAVLDEMNFESMDVDQAGKKRKQDDANAPSKEEGMVLHLKKDDPLLQVFQMMPEDHKKIVLSYNTPSAQKHMIEQWHKAVKDDKKKRTAKLKRDQERAEK